jgi:pimeloyl-ACP methyl ester carboxylesterase
MPSFDTSDGVTLHYSDTGAASGATVVLGAGFLTAASTWRPQVDALRAAGHPVNFDQPEAFNRVLTDFVARVTPP